jgi:transposase-like protein
MTAVRLRGNDYRQRAIDVHRRHIDGETFEELAAEFGCHYDVMRRWVKHGRRYDAPDMDDRDEQRKQATGILWAEILEATDDGDTKALPGLIDRLAKMNGLDHAHRVQEAQLKLDAAKVQMLSDLMLAALEQAEVEIPKRRKVLELIANASNR